MSKTYFIYGVQPVLMALANPGRIIKNIYVADAASSFFANEREIKPQIKDKKFFMHLLGEVNHQNIAAEVMPLEQINYSNFLKQEQSTILILDQVTDPHNVGAVLRSAAAFGVDCIIMPRDNSPEESAVIAKTSVGALEVTPMIYVSNLVNFMKEAKAAGFWCYGMDGEAKSSIYQEKFTAKSIIVMGSEGKGIRKLVRDTCDLLVKIPTSGKIQSLNISCAASIILSHLFVKNYK